MVQWTNRVEVSFGLNPCDALVCSDKRWFGDKWFQSTLTKIYYLFLPRLWPRTHMTITLLFISYLWIGCDSTELVTLYKLN